MRLRRLLAWVCLLICPLLASRGRGAGESARETVVFLNSREELSGDQVFSFTPQESGPYALCALPLGSGAEGVMTLQGTEVASGALPLYAELAAGSEYLIRVRGGAGADFEVMLSAHGRAFETPIAITADTLRYTKSVTNPRDVHWYAYTAPDAGLYTFRSEAADGALDTTGYLLDENGAELAYSDDIIPGSDPNFRMFIRLTAGQTVFVRVSAFSNDTGLYRLVVVPPTGREAEPRSVTLAAGSVTLDIGGRFSLNATLAPEDAYPDLAYSTSDASVARVSPEGVVTAVGAGEAVITASGYGGASAECRVMVNPIDLMDFSLSPPDLSLPAESSYQLAAAFTPSDASDTRLTYTSTDPEVAVVDGSGRVTGVAVGECQIVAASGSGLARVVNVRVTPRAPAYRALVMSEHIYEDGRTRVGAINTAQGISDMLGGNGYAVTLLLDSSYGDFIRGIEAAFAGAREGDVSLFYINCHGECEGGIGYFELHDGARITPAALRKVLDGIPGSVVVLLDFCNSGAFLGTDRWTAPLSDGRFLVLASARFDEKSYRMGNTRDTSEASMAAVFARAVAEAGGWDLMRDRGVNLRADRNRDGSVTFAELYAYCLRRVPFYLEGTDGVQTPVSSSPGNNTVVFQKLE